VKSFTGRTAVITGGASGIGRAVADRFAREGMRIVLADIEQSPLDRAVAEMNASGAQVIGVRTDVADYSQLEALAQESIETFGAIHILCNNAGVASQPANSWEQTGKDWKWVLDVNLWGIINGIRAFVPIMLKQDDEGHVINTASLAGLLSMPGAAPYHASKSAVVAITESLHLEFAAIKSKLRASVLCPAWVKTQILDSARNRPASLSHEERRPVSRLAEAYRKRITEQGLPPEFVADRVFEAVRDEKLYIWTHPEFKDAVRWRMENIINERNPSLEAALGGMAKDMEA
jgi:NAD(P)-dependent dehydrogenase (short-subunit alcohol dehydrogenase family)